MSNFAGNYLFLTTKPLTRSIYEEQQEYLYILALISLVDAELTVKINYTDTTDTSYVLSLGDMAQGVIQCVNVGYSVQDYKSYQPAKTIVSIELKVDNEVEKIVMLPLTIPTDEVREFHYFNSLAGMDSLVCTGDHKNDLETNSDQQKHELSLDSELSDPEYSSFNNLSRIEDEILSGFKPIKEIEATRDLFLVNKMYELKELDDVRGLFPMIIDQKSINYPSSRSNLKSLSFKCRQAYDDVALDRIL